jgi:glycogen operon protein
VFRRRRWFQGQPLRGIVDIGWCRPDGQEMDDEDWGNHHARSIGVYLNGQCIPSRDPRGRRIVDDSFLLLVNAHHEDLPWTLPHGWEESWRRVLSTAGGEVGDEVLKPGDEVQVPARSIVVLRSPMEA